MGWAIVIAVVVFCVATALHGGNNDDVHRETYETPHGFHAILHSRYREDGYYVMCVTHTDGTSFLDCHEVHDSDPALADDGYWDRIRVLLLARYDVAQLERGTDDQ